MTDRTVHVGVIGVGAMGTNHLRVLSAMPGVKVAAIAELDETLRRDRKAAYRVERDFQHYQDLLDAPGIDAIIIAVQPENHRQVAVDAFARGLPVLLEKPVAHTLEEADAIVEAAEKSGASCLVGHIERFNPVVRKTREFIQSGAVGTPYLCKTQRCGPFPRRLLKTNVGVLIDLAVHDVDVIQHLTDKRIETVDALFIRTENRELFANVLYRCDDGLAGSMEFSWISPLKVRTFQLYGTLGLIEGNYITQSLRFYENPDQDVMGDPWATNHLGQGRIMSGRIIEYPIWHSEPLRVELDHFMDVVRGKAQPDVTPRMARQVLGVVVSIMQAGVTSRTTVTCAI